MLQAIASGWDDWLLVLQESDSGTASCCEFETIREGRLGRANCMETILNVDDNEANRYTKSRILRSAGYAV